MQAKGNLKLVNKNQEAIEARQKGTAATMRARSVGHLLSLVTAERLQESDPRELELTLETVGNLLMIAADELLLTIDVLKPIK